MDEINKAIHAIAVGMALRFQGTWDAADTLRRQQLAAGADSNTRDAACERIHATPDGGVDWLRWVYQRVQSVTADAYLVIRDGVFAVDWRTVDGVVLSVPIGCRLLESPA